MLDIKAYKEILKVLEKHQETLKSDYQIDIADRLRERIRLHEISKEFGIDIKPDANSNWCKVGYYQNIAIIGGDTKRTISWSDDGSQPNGERLYIISFPTGAYIFGDFYPTNTFQDFFNELREYNPKYTDTSNKTLYFTSETASKVHDNFKVIFDKYKNLVGNELKEQRIIALKKELNDIED